MKDLIKKELLSLVLGKEVHDNIMKENAWGAYDNYLTYFTSEIEPDNIVEHHINLDTLTRFMKEWCGKQGYVIYSDCYGTLDIYLHGATFPIDKKIISRLFDINEITAIINATKWVANKEGLLK